VRAAYLQELDCCVYRGLSARNCNGASRRYTYSLTLRLCAGRTKMQTPPQWYVVDPDSGRYLSEDYALCRLWRDIGGKVFADLECKLNHLGQHMFRGDLPESLRVQGRW